jgi:hypothetical protein
MAPSKLDQSASLPHRRATPLPRVSQDASSPQEALAHIVSPSGGLGLPEGILLLLLLGQPVLLEASAGQVDSQKLIYIAIFGAFYLVYAVPVLLQLNRWLRQQVVRWTIALLFLLVLSALVAYFNGVKASDYVRDFSALVDYSWILFVPYFFRSGKSIRTFYFTLLCAVTMLAICQANNFMVERGYASVTIQALSVVKETGPASLFGIFIAAALMNSSTGRTRILYASWMSAMVLTAFLSGTRTTLVSAFMGFGFYLWLLWKDRCLRRQQMSFWVMALPFVLGIILFTSAVLLGLVNKEAVMERISETSQTDETISIAARVVESQNAWKAFGQDPFFGQGLGFKLGNSHLAELHTTEQHDFYYIHDFPLWVLAKFGIIGALIWTGFIVAGFRTVLRGFKLCRDPFAKAVFGSTAALIVAVLIQSIAANPFCVRASVGIFSILLGLVVVLFQKYTHLAPRSKILKTPLPDHDMERLPSWLK